ncbi:discoidin domain-containing protein [Geodermatophilus sp. SYSU D00691]
MEHRPVGAPATDRLDRDGQRRLGLVPAGNVLDRNAGTFWHSRSEGAPVPLPHSLTIDMRSVQGIGGLRYLPRQDGIPNGTIGQFTVATSRDGAAWSARPTCRGPGGRRRPATPRAGYSAGN